MTFFARLLVFPLLWFSLTGQATPILVPDVSQRQINILSGFTGEELLLFGAISYPGGTIPDDEIDIAVVLKGPSNAVTLREKRKIAGIWINAASTEFRSVPSFYAVAASRPISEIVDEKTAAIYELGLDHLHLSPASSISSAELQPFETGLVDLNERNGMYSQSDNVVEISDSILYRARISIPASVPVGKYTAETFLIQKGRVVAAATRDIVIAKSGFERLVATMAEFQSFLYGILAVLISVIFGWSAGYLFRKM